MNTSNISKLVLVSLIFSTVQGSVLAMDADDAASAVAQEAPSRVAKISERIKEETKNLVANFLELRDNVLEKQEVQRVIQGTQDFFYNGYQGVFEASKEGAQSILNESKKLVLKITPQDPKNIKEWVPALVVVTIVGGTATAVYYFKDNTYVQYSLGAIKSFVTSPKVLVAATALALTAGYYKKTGDKKTSLYVLGGLTGLYCLKKVGGYLLNKCFGTSKEQKLYNALADCAKNHKRLKHNDVIYSMLKEIHNTTLTPLVAGDKGLFVLIMEWKAAESKDAIEIEIQAKLAEIKHHLEL